LTLDISSLLFIMPVGSNTRAHANKRNAIAVFHMSKETLKACLLPKKARYYISEQGKTKTVKKQPNMSVSGGLPSGEAPESNEATTKEKGE
jgi:hypothetical protein